MLILKPRDQLTEEDIRDFCGRFDEGIRVEYKRDLDQDVRDKLPQITSSFANSYGGVLILGNPYDLADIDLIERLIKRRDNVSLCVDTEAPK